MTSLEHVLLAVTVAVGIALWLCYRFQVRDYARDERRIAADVKRAEGE